MATPKQIAANRANAARSTGPKTQAGKAASSQNARKHGIFGRDVAHELEDPLQFDGLVEGLRADLKPASALEDELVDQLALAFWRNRRLAKAEQFELNGGTARSVSIHTGVREQARPAFTYLDARDHSNFTIKRMVLFGRYQTMITNEIKRTLSMLYEAQERRIEAIEASAIEANTSEAKPDSLDQA
ncbi:hypothetical protein L2D00_06650 [Hyphomonadaceae bacterium BL14]|nr:hypothetical protein L2D00_06650 [Hyphomonadaceae bacterium BL14]